MAQVHTRKQTIVGSILVALGMLSWGLSEVIIAYFNIKIIPLQLIANCTILLCAIIYWNMMKTPLNINHWYGDTKHKQINIWCRGLLMSLVPFFYYSCIRLPLGDLQTILYQSPLWIVYFGWLLFNEQLPPFYILTTSTLFTIIGILLISQPQFIMHTKDGLNIDGLIAVGITCIRWIGCVLFVKSGENIHFIQYEFSATICNLFISFPLIMIVCTYYLDNKYLGSFDDIYNLQIQHILMSICCGLSGFLGMALNVKGYQIGDATIVSWLEYINVPISFLYQIYIFHDIPNQYEYIGAILVLLGSILPVMHTTLMYDDDDDDDAYIAI